MLFRSLIKTRDFVIFFLWFLNISSTQRPKCTFGAEWEPNYRISDYIYVSKSSEPGESTDFVINPSDIANDEKNYKKVRTTWK